jgi:hypothetical protein
MLFNNYGAVYLVNNRVLLIPGLFSKLNRRIIEAGTSSIPIIGTNIRIIKRIFNNNNELAIKDLLLKQVVVIKGFYINIVFKACLRNIEV